MPTIAQESRALDRSSYIAKQIRHCVYFLHPTPSVILRVIVVQFTGDHAPVRHQMQ